MDQGQRRVIRTMCPMNCHPTLCGMLATVTPLYLMEQTLTAPGTTRSLSWVLQALAARFGLTGFYPWQTEEEVIDAILHHPATGHATVASLRQQQGIAPLHISHVAYPEHRYHTPSGHVEFYSTRALEFGRPPLPVYHAPSPSSYPLTLCQGRTLTHFHSFYDHGQALPSLARLDPEPQLWRRLRMQRLAACKMV